MILKKFILDNFSNYKFKLVKIKDIDRGFLNLLSKRKIGEKFFIKSIKDIDKKEIDNFVFILRVLDFMLWKYPNNWKFKNKEGFFGLVERIKILFKNNFRNINFEKFRKIISPKEDLKLAKSRYRIYKNSLKWLIDSFGGNFINYFEEYKNPYDFSMNLLKLKKFKDYHRNFYFLKPNQLLYYEFFLAKGFNKSEYLNELSIFADNKIPQILISFGILEIPEKYLKKIKTGNVLRSKSLFENEVRIASILIGEMISEYLKAPSYIIDNLLWHLPDNILKIPRIKVNTIFY